MKDTVNSYFATLLLVIAGIGAGWLIYHLATTNTLTTTFGGSEAKLAPLQQLILQTHQ